MSNASLSAPSNALLTDCTLSEKLIPLNRKRQLFLTLGVIFFIPAITISFSRVPGRVLEPLWLLFPMAVFFVFGAYSFHLSHQYTKKKKTLISTHFLHSMLAEQFELYHFDPLAHFSAEELEPAQLKPEIWNKAEGNDLFQASYQGVTFRFSNMKLSDSSSPYLGSSSIWKLKGQWLILDLHKAISAPLIVSELENKGQMGKAARIETGNADFDKRFTVLCEHPDLVPQVLSEDFMKFLLHYDCIFAYHKRHVCFKENVVHICIKSDRYIFSPWDYVRDIPAMREQMLGEMDELKKIIDGFLQIDALFEASGTTDNTASLYKEENGL